jgi:predicted MFS family arabinose efflux permease
MGYLRELLVNWRALLGATIGLAAGFSSANYVTSIMAPHMIDSFGWTRAEFASVGSLSLLTTAFLPLAGRLADVMGVRKTALIGLTAMPLAFLALSAQTGDLRLYMVLFVAQAIICITSTATVLTRVVVQYIQNARGIALAIAASGPALAGVALAPLLNNFVEAHGWRQGYVVAAAYAAIFGAIALLLLPPERKSGAAPAPRAGRARDDYPEILRTPAFWVMAIALLLCNLPQVIALTQLNLILIENGATPLQVSAMISAFASGTLAGRFLCGIALDRFPAHIVSAIGMGMPAMGLFLLASNVDTPMALSASVLLIGLAFGAEGDLVAYLVVRHFGVRIYSSVLGLMTAVISTSASLGALLVGATLAATDSYVLFLNICGGAVAIGGVLFLMLKPPAIERQAVVVAQAKG